MKYIILLFLVFTFISCDNEPKVNTLFTLKKSEETSIAFTNTVENTDQFNIFSYRNFYNGGGVAIGDINNDGLPDVYLTANMGENKLYINKGNFEFEDISVSANVTLKDKWSTGVVMVDVNHDGYLDLYVCNAGYLQGQDQKNVLFVNNQDNTFTDKAAEYNLDQNGYTTHAAFFDYDKDGDLDAYILNNSFIPTNTLNYSNKRDLKADDWPVKDFLKGGGDKFLRNDSGKFVDVSDQCGIYQSLIGFGLGVTVGDMNGDGWEDLYISNDFFEKDYFYINNTDGTFRESLEECFGHISHSSMGADLRDINNDGRPDLFVTDMLPIDDYRLKTTASFDDINLRKLKESQGFYQQYMHNTMQLNAGEKFKEISFQTGVAASDWSWGALMFDADNDQFTDLYICNGIYHDVIDLDFMDFFANELMQKMALSGKKEDMSTVIEKMPTIPLQNLAFRNEAGTHFSQANADWGLTEKTFSNGAAYGDLDNDGDLDLIVNNVNQPCLVYQNNSTNPSLTINLKGLPSNPKAIGAKAYLYTDTGTQYYQVNPSRGFQSSVDYPILFGLGKATIIDSLKIVWTDGSTQTTNPALDAKIITIQYNPTQDAETNHPKSKQTLFIEVETDLITHQEDDYIDYYKERGLYRMLSKEGPKASVADIDGDGLEDIYIGGASGQPAQIYIQQGGKLSFMHQPDIAQDARFEDTAALFFDVDGDGDQDLFVGSGGNHYQPNDTNLLDRLYINDGQGNFSRSNGFSTSLSMNTSTVLANDYDQDGDLDLFVFSRSVPQYFGYSPIHFLFDNDGKGNFKEVTAKVVNNFKGLGMVTDAVFVEDKLVVVSEWDSPRFYVYRDGKYTIEDNNLKDLRGLYYTVAAADLDGDGDQDLVFGNHGTNSYLQASMDSPLSLWINDFDGNGSAEKIITKLQNGKEMPLLLKKEMADQIVSIKKLAIKNSEYATKSIHELFPKEMVDKSNKRQCNTMYSYVAFNDGNGNYTVQNLPYEAQLSCLKALNIVDIDRDGDLDILAGGNEYNLLPQFSRMDANFGSFIRNDGEQHFTYLPETATGIYLVGEVKDIHTLTLGGEQNHLFIRNNLSPVLIKSTK